MKKILAVGNSFSQDATALIEFLTEDIYVRNLYIGGCSIERHVALMDTDEKPYEYQHNGENCLLEFVSLAEALGKEKWDYITIQQASGFSGIYASYYPFIKALIAFIRKRSSAEIIFHQTWAYEKDSTHPDFVKYNNNQDEMWQKIKEVSEQVCQDENLRMIKCGETIAKLREFDYFDIEKKGLSLNRDGFHMNLSFGRFATACTWIKFFTGELPEYLNREDISFGYSLIKKVLNEK